MPLRTVHESASQVYVVVYLSKHEMHEGIITYAPGRRLEGEETESSTETCDLTGHDAALTHTPRRKNSPAQVRVQCAGFGKKEERRKKKEKRKKKKKKKREEEKKKKKPVLGGESGARYQTIDVDV